LENTDTYAIAQHLANLMDIYTLSVNTTQFFLGVLGIYAHPAT